MFKEQFDSNSKYNSPKMIMLPTLCMILIIMALETNGIPYFVHPTRGADSRLMQIQGTNRTMPFRSVQFAVNEVAVQGDEIILITGETDEILHYKGGELCAQNVLGGGSFEETNAETLWLLRGQAEIVTGVNKLVHVGDKAVRLSSTSSETKNLNSSTSSGEAEHTAVQVQEGHQHRVRFWSRAIFEKEEDAVASSSLLPVGGTCAILSLLPSSSPPWNASISCSTSRSWQLHEYWRPAGSLGGDEVVLVLNLTERARAHNLTVVFDDISLVPFPTQSTSSSSSSSSSTSSSSFASDMFWSESVGDDCAQRLPESGVTGHVDGARVKDKYCDMHTDSGGYELFAIDGDGDKAIHRERMKKKEEGSSGGGGDGGGVGTIGAGTTDLSDLGVYKQKDAYFADEGVGSSLTEVLVVVKKRSDGWFAGDNGETCHQVCWRQGLSCDGGRDAISTEEELQEVALSTGVYGGAGCLSVQFTPASSSFLSNSAWYRTGAQASTKICYSRYSSTPKKKQRCDLSSLNNDGLFCYCHDPVAAACGGGEWCKEGEEGGYPVRVDVAQHCEDETLGRRSIKSREECEAAAIDMGLTNVEADVSSWSHHPPGCYWRTDHETLKYNTNSASTAPCQSIGSTDRSDCICIVTAVGSALPTSPSRWIKISLSSDRPIPATTLFDDVPLAPSDVYVADSTSSSSTSSSSSESRPVVPRQEAWVVGTDVGIVSSDWSDCRSLGSGDGGDLRPNTLLRCRLFWKHLSTYTPAGHWTCGASLRLFDNYRVDGHHNKPRDQGGGFTTVDQCFERCLAHPQCKYFVKATSPTGGFCAGCSGYYVPEDSNGGKITYVAPFHYDAYAVKSPLGRGK